MAADSRLPVVQVVAAVLRDRQGRVLIAERPAGKPLAGFWEFPGGKLEAGERPADALRRELREELGIEAQAAYRLLRFSHVYPDKRVELDVWRVTRYQGIPQPHEGQRLAWARPGELSHRQLLPADQPIVAALCLPPLMLVTPTPLDRADFLANLRSSLDAGIDLVQFRAPGMDPHAFAGWANDVIRLCHEAGARALVNGGVDAGPILGADGIHLSQAGLQRRSATRQEGGLLGISCHTAAEISAALAYTPDYLVVGPVKVTATHPQAAPLGWQGLQQLAALSAVPVYAIGGLGLDDLETARQSGAYGVAAIRGLWGLAQLSSGS